MSAEREPTFRETVEIAKDGLRVIRAAEREVDAEEFEAARGPRPKRTAREFAKQPKPPAVIEDVLGADVNVLGGPSEAGKSLLARDWALHLAAGRAWHGHSVPQVCNVLVVFSEGSHDFAERWMSQPLWEKAAGRIYVLDEPVDLVNGTDVDWLLAEYADEHPAHLMSKPRICRPVVAHRGGSRRWLMKAIFRWQKMSHSVRSGALPTQKDARWQ